LEMGVATMQPIVLGVIDTNFLKIVIDKVVNNIILQEFLDITINLEQCPKLIISINVSSFKILHWLLENQDTSWGKEYADFTHWLSVVCPEIGLQILSKGYPVPLWLIKRLEGDND